MVVLVLSLMLVLFGQAATPSWGNDRTISLSHLTSGGLAKSGLTTEITTAPFAVPPDSLGLVHLMGCCDHAAVPSVVGAALRWDLLVTHTTGEKRHWVFRAATGATQTSGALTVRFSTAQSRVLWIVDSVTGTPTGNNGADAVVQTRWQNSQTNASSGSIALSPLLSPANAAVGFALAGSGQATNIEPKIGFKETGEAETTNSSLIISTFWSAGDASVSAAFLDDQGQPQVESWTFLAAELRVSGTAPKGSTPTLSPTPSPSPPPPKG